MGAWEPVLEEDRMLGDKMLLQLSKEEEGQKQQGRKRAIFHEGESRSLACGRIWLF